MGRKTDASQLGRTFVTGSGLHDCRRRSCRVVRLRHRNYRADCHRLRRYSAEKARSAVAAHYNSGRFAVAAHCNWGRSVAARCNSGRSAVVGRCNSGRSAVVGRCSWARSDGARYSWGARELPAARSLTNPGDPSRCWACQSVAPGRRSGCRGTPAAELRATDPATGRRRRTDYRSAATRYDCHCAGRPAG